MSSRRQKPPTLTDVAKAAGVSLPTVSRVVAGTVPVRPETRDRVRAAMADLGYRPNAAARALVRGDQSIVAVIVPDTVSIGSNHMLAAIEQRAREAGYAVAVAVVDPQDLETKPKSLDALLSQPIVGVIVLEYSAYNPELLGSSLRGLPVATVTYSSQPDAQIPHVLIDDRLAAREVTRHFLSLGHRTVHHVAVPGTHGGKHSRELGWRDALKEAGASIPAPVSGDWTLEAGLHAGRLLAADPSVSAIFCSNDNLAFAVMRSLQEAGRRVPEDISVAGLDDEPLAKIWLPSLTTYRLDWGWAGASAFDLLFDKSEGLPGIPASHAGLMARQSSARRIETCERPAC